MASVPPGSFDPALIRVAVSLARRYGAAADADDVAQEALIKLLSYSGRVEEPVAWLTVVVRRLIQRRARRRERILVAQLGAVDPWPGLELMIDTRRLMNALSERGRRSLRLRVAGYSEQEIASKLGCSIKATEKSLHNARRRLRALQARP